MSNCISVGAAIMLSIVMFALRTRIVVPGGNDPIKTSAAFNPVRFRRRMATAGEEEEPPCK